MNRLRRKPTPFPTGIKETASTNDLCHDNIVSHFSHPTAYQVTSGGEKGGVEWSK